MNYTKIIAIGLVIILIGVVGFIAINVNDKSENGDELSKPDSEYYPITVEAYDPETKKMIDMKFTEKPKRVIVSDGGALDLLMTLGLEDLISEAFLKRNYVLSNLDLKEKYDKVLPKIYLEDEISIERYISLEPDFIIGWNTTFIDSIGGTMSYWNGEGVNSYLASNWWGENTEEGLKHVENIGKIFNIQSEAQKYIDAFNKSIEDIKKKTEGLNDKEKPKVLAIEVYDTNVLYGYGNGTITTELIELAGGICVYTGSPGDIISREAVVGMNPDIILLVINTGDFRDPDNIKKRHDELYAIEGFASISAIKNKNIIDYGVYEVVWTGIMPLDILDRLYEDFHIRIN